MKVVILLVCLLAGASGKVYFSETFGQGWEKRWTLSKWKEVESNEKMGIWTTSAGKWFRDAEEDKGIQTAETMKFYGISSEFESFSNEGKDLVIQYQAKYEKELGCGGGYVKVGPKQEDMSTFGDPTPYHIMFGPDQCNADKRTHLIFSYKGKNYLKKSELPYKQEGEGMSHLYRLVLKPDGSVRVEVDQEKIYEGALNSDWDMLPNATIIDPKDKKPDDWADEAMINDPTDKKPEGWVTEKRIVDADATRPEEWDDEEDGEWEAPKVDNPEFKGEWVQKQISNPEYKGVWAAKQIQNPDFVDDPVLYKYDDIAYVGFDVYQVKGGTIFDNVIISDNTADAEAFAKSWKALSEVEKSKNVTDAGATADQFAKMRAARAARDEKKKEADKAMCAAIGTEDACKEKGKPCTWLSGSCQFDETPADTLPKKKPSDDDDDDDDDMDLGGKGKGAADHPEL